MGFFSRFENKMEDAVEGTANRLSKSPISPVQISKQCEKQMTRNKMVGAGKQYAPTLYTVLVNPDDDARLFSFYPTLAGEIETTIRAKAGQIGLFMDGQPLVRFIVDDNLKHGKFDVIAEVVAAGIVTQLRAEEMERYGLTPAANQRRQQAAQGQRPQQSTQAPAGYGDDAPALNRNQPATNQAYAGQDEYYDGDYRGGASFGDPLGDDPYGEQSLENSIDPYAPRTVAPQTANSMPENDLFDEPVYDPFAPASTVSEAGMAGAASAAGAAAGGMQQPQTRRPTQSLLVDDANGRTYTLTRSGMVAGRSKDCDIVIPDINASRQHARFIQDASGRWAVVDLGSKNGTLVNGGFIQDPTSLYDGDIITLGLTTYTYTVR